MSYINVYIYLQSYKSVIYDLLIKGISLEYIYFINDLLTS